MSGAGTYKFAVELLSFRTTLKMYHWTTFKYSRHIATCGFLDTLDTAIDTMIETYSGKHGRPIIAPKESMTIAVYNLGDRDLPLLLERMETYLLKTVPTYLAPDDTDMVNLRDDLLGHVRKLMYLITLE